MLGIPDEPAPHSLDNLVLKYHPAMPNWCKIIGLKIKPIPECEGGGFAVYRHQAEIIMDLRAHVMRLEALVMEKNRTIAAVRDLLNGGA
jgi:hypothetical protein